MSSQFSKALERACISTVERTNDQRFGTSGTRKEYVGQRLFNNTSVLTKIKESLDKELTSIKDIHKKHILYSTIK